MADQQEQPENRPDAAPETPAQPSAPDAAKAAAKKAPAKKVPAKKAPAKAVKKAPAKKAPAKKAPAKKVLPLAESEADLAREADLAPAAPLTQSVPELPLAATNGAGPVPEGAKEAAAQAKTTVDEAIDNVMAPLVQPAERGRSPLLPVAVALGVSLLAVLVVRQLRRSSDPD